MTCTYWRPNTPPLPGCLRATTLSRQSLRVPDASFEPIYQRKERQPAGERMVAPGFVHHSPRGRFAKRELEPEAEWLSLSHAAQGDWQG